MQRRSVPRSAPQAMVAYAAGAAALAHFINDQKLRTWTKSFPVLVGAERLWPHDRAAIQEAFGPAFETYGCREVMLMSSEFIARFITKNPTIKMLALSFIMMIGVFLIAEGLDMHVPKGYIYFGMAFSMGVEMLNMWVRKKKN